MLFNLQFSYLILFRLFFFLFGSYLPFAYTPTFLILVFGQRPRFTTIYICIYTSICVRRLQEKVLIKVFLKSFTNKVSDGQCIYIYRFFSTFQKLVSPSQFFFLHRTHTHTFGRFVFVTRCCSSRITKLFHLLNYGVSLVYIYNYVCSVLIKISRATPRATRRAGGGGGVCCKL